MAKLEFLFSKGESGSMGILQRTRIGTPLWVKLALAVAGSVPLMLLAMWLVLGSRQASYSAGGAVGGIVFLLLVLGMRWRWLEVVSVGMFLCIAICISPLVIAAKLDLSQAATLWVSFFSYLLVCFALVSFSTRERP